MGNDIIPYWKQQEIAAKERKALQEKNEREIFGYKDIGRTVFFSGEYGVLVLSSDFDLDRDGEQPSVCIRWDTNREYDFEGYGGNWMPEFVDTSHEFKYINQDGTLKRNNK